MAMLGDASSPSSPTERDAEYPARRTGDGPSPNAAAERLDRSDPSDLMGTSTRCRSTGSSLGFYDAGRVHLVAVVNEGFEPSDQHSASLIEPAPDGFAAHGHRIPMTEMVGKQVEKGARGLPPFDTSHHPGGLPPLLRGCRRREHTRCQKTGETFAARPVHQGTFNGRDAGRYPPRDEGIGLRDPRATRAFGRLVRQESGPSLS